MLVHQCSMVNAFIIITSSVITKIDTPEIHVSFIILTTKDDIFLLGQDELIF